MVNATTEWACVITWICVAAEVEEALKVQDVTA